MADYMSAKDFANKITWEDGATGALDYGLRHTDLDPDDEESAPLRETWAKAEVIWKSLSPIIDEIDSLVERLADDET